MEEIKESTKSSKPLYLIRDHLNNQILMSKLFFSNFGLGDEGISLIANEIQNHNLTEIDLKGNRITGYGLTEFSKKIRHLRNMDYIGLDWNPIGMGTNEGLNQLSILIKDYLNLKFLDLRNCNLNDTNKLELSEILRFGKIKSIDLRFNELSDDSISLFLESIKNNKTILNLDLSGNNIKNIKYINEISKILKENNLKNNNDKNLKLRNNDYYKERDNLNIKLLEIITGKEKHKPITITRTFNDKMSYKRPNFIEEIEILIDQEKKKNFILRDNLHNLFNNETLISRKLDEQLLLEKNQNSDLLNQNNKLKNDLEDLKYKYEVMKEKKNFNIQVLDKKLNHLISEINIYKTEREVQKEELNQKYKKLIKNVEETWSNKFETIQESVRLAIIRKKDKIDEIEKRKGDLDKNHKVSKYYIDKFKEQLEASTNLTLNNNFTCLEKVTNIIEMSKESIDRQEIGLIDDFKKMEKRLLNDFQKYNKEEQEIIEKNETIDKLILESKGELKKWEMKSETSNFDKNNLLEENFKIKNKIEDKAENFNKIYNDNKLNLDIDLDEIKKTKNYYEDRIFEVESKIADIIIKKNEILEKKRTMIDRLRYSVNKEIYDSLYKDTELNIS